MTQLPFETQKEQRTRLVHLHSAAEQMEPEPSICMRQEAASSSPWPLPWYCDLWLNEKEWDQSELWCQGFQAGDGKEWEPGSWWTNVVLQCHKDIFISHADVLQRIYWEEGRGKNNYHCMQSCLKGSTVVKPTFSDMLTREKANNVKLITKLDSNWTEKNHLCESMNFITLKFFITSWGLN